MVKKKLTREQAGKEIVKTLQRVCQLILVEGCGDIESKNLGLECEGDADKFTGTVRGTRYIGNDNKYEDDKYEEFKFKYKINIEVE